MLCGEIKDTNISTSIKDSENQTHGQAVESTLELRRMDSTEFVVYTRDYNENLSLTVKYYIM